MVSSHDSSRAISSSSKDSSHGEIMEIRVIGDHSSNNAINNRRLEAVEVTGV